MSSAFEILARHLGIGAFWGKSVYADLLTVTE